MYWADAYKTLWSWSITVPDENNILKLKDLNNIWKYIKNTWIDLDKINLDDIDMSNLINWYNNYKIAYSYPERENKLSKKWKWIIEKINNDKWESDIMWLVEISIWRLLQNKFEKEWHDVRVRKTTNFDDITSGIDYVIEFFDKNWEIINVIGMDFTVSKKWADSLYKNIKKEAFPEDYKYYHEKKYGKKLKKVSRVVFTLSKDLAYSFTNNFFTEVLEKWMLLDNEDIDENLSLAIQELKNKSNIRNVKFVISNTKEKVSSNVDKLLYNK